MRHDQLSDLLCAILKDALAGRRKRVPEVGALIWEAFAALCGTRTYHAAGPNPISFAEIEAFARIERLPLKAHHVEVIRAMDRVWCEVASARAGTSSDKPIVSRSSEQIITPELFDAVF